MNQTDHYLKENVESNWFNESELGGKTMKESVGLKAKTYSYLIDDSSHDKKAKWTKKCVIKKNFKIIKAVQKQISLKIKL